MVDGLVTSINLFDICVVLNHLGFDHDSIALHFHLHCLYIVLYILHIILHSLCIVMHAATNIVPVKLSFFSGTICYVRFI